MATRKKGVQQESAVNDSCRVYRAGIFIFVSRIFIGTYPRALASALASASVGQVGKYYNDSLTVENPHDTPLHDGSLSREKRQR